MKLSQKYAMVMFDGRKQMDAEITESILSVGLLAAILYEMLDENILKLEEDSVFLSSNCEISEGAKGKIVSQMRLRGEHLTLDDWFKHLVFSVDALCMKIIVSETEKEMIEKGYVVLVEKKSLFTKKMIYGCGEEDMANLTKEITKLETFEDFLLLYLLNKCGLLSYVLTKKDFRTIKQVILSDVHMNDGFIKKINQIISSVSSTLATVGIMM